MDIRMREVISERLIEDESFTATYYQTHYKLFDNTVSGTKFSLIICLYG